MYKVSLNNRNMYDALKVWGKTDSMRKNNSWRFPFGIKERLLLSFSKMLTRYSCFANMPHITHTDDIDPIYRTLFSYLKKNKLAESIAQRNLHYPGYFFYSLEKKLVQKGHIRSISGHGIAKEKMTALSKAFGEMLERIISGASDTNTCILIGSPSEIKKKFPVLYPPKYHRFLHVQKEQYKELKTNQNDSITWVDGMNLITEEKTYIPRQITSWFIKNRKEAPLINATTSGSAGYFTKEGALLRGLLETIERDAFLVHWLTQIPPRIIKEETLPKEIQEKIHQFASMDISIQLVDTTALAIPSVLAIAIHNKEAPVPQIVLSGASATTFEQAIQNSLREMVVSAEMFYYPITAALEQEISQFTPFISRLGQIPRLLFWRGPERIKQFQWFLSGKQVSYDDLCTQDITTASDDTTQLKVCLNVLKEKGPDYYPIVYFPKHPIQKKLGFYVAQVYVPKAFPLYLLECQGTFDSDRLQAFADSQGVTEWTLNPLPHMFP